MLRKTIIALGVAVLSVAFAPMALASSGWTGGHDVVGCTQAATTWYFAEGTTRTGFNEWVCLYNPADNDTSATFTYMLEDGSTEVKTYELRAASRTTVDVNLELGPGHDVSIKVDSAAPVVAERPMYFRYNGMWTGGHDVVGTNGPLPEWFFAEGTCRPGFDPYICIQNPGSGDAAVLVTYMLGDGTTREENLTVGAHSRSTVVPRQLLGEGDDAAHDFSAHVETTNGALIVAERPMYFNYKGGWSGGHDVVGATAPSTAFHFAEGTCRPGFDPYLCIQNPSDKTSRLRITYMLGSGATQAQSLAISPHSRSTVVVKQVLGEFDDPAHDFSASVETTDGSKVIAERPMYFNYKGAWTGGHDVVGATSPAQSFSFAEGTCRPGFDAYLCIQNPGPETSAINITYVLGDGTSRQQALDVGPNSRATVFVKDVLGEGNDPAHDFSATVATTNGTEIIAERPIYYDYYSTAKWSMAVLGDVNLGGDVSPTLAANGFGYVWTGVGPYISEATLGFANLECTMSYQGSPVPGKTFTFEGDPNALPAMRDAGVDVVSQANNHARDYGAVALLDCLGYLDGFGIAHCGAGADYESAHVPAYLDAEGLRVAFLAYDDIGTAGWYADAGYPGVCDATDTGRLIADVQAASLNADFVVVSFHWGNEKEYTPTARQANLARLSIDCGADIVLGHHPHVVQGMEIYNGGLICYSLGNFVFNPGSDAGHYTILTRISLDSRGFLQAESHPVHIDSCRPTIMGGEAGAAWINQVAAIVQGLGTPARVQDNVMYVP
ncbi:MAG: CapA family protein [Actinobacteria bacterium]|nr:CapA family protein [Actinomycetota bacterium]MBU1944313.1 CapA family protein [Actinomycetota bacterium]MBU2688298.1 CapA family protein [Actinomycetota bacterium]